MNDINLIEKNFEKMVEAGYLTIFNTKTKNRFCYNISQSKDNENMYFVGLHNEMTNAREVKFPSLGYFFTDRKDGKLVFRPSKTVDVAFRNVQINAFQFVLNNIETLDKFPTLEYKFERWYCSF
jgi:hypothetical protein